VIVREGEQKERWKRTTLQIGEGKGTGEKDQTRTLSFEESNERETRGG